MNAGCELRPALSSPSGPVPLPFNFTFPPYVYPALENCLKKKYLTIACLSDTHALHDEVTVPPSDIVIVAGDFTMFDRDPAVVESFNRFLGNLNTKHKPIVTFGNHEFGFEADPARRNLLSNATVLVNESVSIEGLKFWGSPGTTLTSGAFGMADPNERKVLFELIPRDTDVVITHGPPAIEGHPFGDPVLLRRILEIAPLMHVFGHEHTGYGTSTIAGTLFANCALLGTGGAIAHPPVMVRLPRL